jgi:hypothetical protein
MTEREALLILVPYLCLAARRDGRQGFQGKKVRE